MTPQTEAKINEAIEWLHQPGGSLQDIAAEQAPLYCQEVISWKIWNGVIFGGCGGIMILISLVAAVKFVRWMKQDDGKPNSRTLPAFAIAVISFLIGAPMFGCHIPEAIKAVVSPRLVIVEHITGLRS